MGFLENEYIVYQKKPLDLVRTFENNFKYANSPLTNTIFTKNFMRIVELLYKNRDNPIDNQLRKKNTYVESTIRFINEHYSESNLSIKDIATQLFIYEKKRALRFACRYFRTEKAERNAYAFNKNRR